MDRMNGVLGLLNTDFNDSWRAVAPTASKSNIYDRKYCKYCKISNVKRRKRRIKLIVTGVRVHKAGRANDMKISPSRGPHGTTLGYVIV